MSLSHNLRGLRASFFVQIYKVGIMKKIKKFNEFFQRHVLENNEEEDLEYSFTELSPEAKEKALDEFRYSLVEHDDWHDDVIEYFKDQLGRNYGVDDIEVQYSGFYSQGDGASFTGRVDDMKKFLLDALEMKSSEYLNMEDGEDEEDELRRLVGDLRSIGYDSRSRLTPEDIYIEIVRRSHNYSHENTIEANVTLEEIEEVEGDQRDWNKFYDELDQKATEWAREESVNLYSQLYREYENLTSDEVVEEHILDNDYKFDENGNLV